MREVPGRAKWTVALAVVGSVGLALSFGAVLVMAPIGLVLFAKGMLERDYRWLAMLALTGASWVALSAVVYFGVYAGQTATISNMQNIYWGQGARHSRHFHPIAGRRGVVPALGG